MELVKRIETLAEKLTDFSEDYDYYGFRDAVCDRNQAITETTQQLWDKGERRSIVNWLDTIISDDEDDEWAIKATELRREITAL